MATDISDLPPPPSVGGVDISDLPPPPPAPGKKVKPVSSLMAKTEMPESAASRNKALLYGLGTSLVTPLGQIEQMVTPESKGQLKGQETVFTTPKQLREGLQKSGIAPTLTPQEEKYAEYGELIPAVVLGGRALKQGLGAAGDVAKGFISGFKKPAAIAEAESLDVVGEKGFDLIKKRSEKLYGERAAEADKKYGDAFDAARKAQAAGQPFATSPQGQALLQILEKEKTVLAGGERFARGEEKIAGINRLIDAIKGKTTGGVQRVPKETPTGKKIFRMEGEPKKTTEKDIEAIVEELRFLRDVDAKGKPYEAYASLDAKYKRDLISKLESALYSWNDEYRLADEAYKAASAKLAPFKTQLMSGALKGEKFDPKNLVASPEDFGPKFFSDVDGVRQLKNVTQDSAAVSQLAKEYVASLMSNKTPQQVQAFAKDPKNIGWMRESGVLDDVTKYANAAEKAESRQEILKKLGYAAGASTLGAAIGLPMYYGIRRTFGL